MQHGVMLGTAFFFKSEVVQIQYLIHGIKPPLPDVALRASKIGAAGWQVVFTT